MHMGPGYECLGPENQPNADRGGAGQIEVRPWLQGLRGKEERGRPRGGKASGLRGQNQTVKTVAVKAWCPGA